MDSIRILHGDVREVLPTLDAESIDCIVTSPPYWGLRDYGVEGQLGREETPEEYLDVLVDVFDKCYRVLRPSGTMWINMGDSYSTSGSGPRGNTFGESRPTAEERGLPNKSRWVKGAGRKQVLGLPGRLARRLQEIGWIRRADVIWHKPTTMPESVKDRPTAAHEYVFLFVKSRFYFYSQEHRLEPVTGNAHSRGSGLHWKARLDPKKAGRIKANESFSKTVTGLVDRRNIRSVWTIPACPYPGAHFATFPPKLAERCVLLGCRPGGTVLDPFSGTGTVGLVCKQHGLRYVGIEINREYVELSKERLSQGHLFEAKEGGNE